MLDQHRNESSRETFARALPAARRVTRAGLPLTAILAFVVGSSAVHYAPELGGADESVAIGSVAPAADPLQAAPAGNQRLSTLQARHAPVLTAEQQNVSRFIAKRYRVAMDQTQMVVQHAYQVAREAKLDPLLVLAVISVESSFDPKAQSSKGAQGLMQVLTRVHAERFAPFGGVSAAFDPVANMRVGTQILQEYLKRAGGSVEHALKYYVGAALLPHDGGYGAKVLFERERIAAAASGRPQPVARRSEPPRMIEASVRPAPEPATDSIAQTPSGAVNEALKEALAARSTAELPFRPWVEVERARTDDVGQVRAPASTDTLDEGRVRDI